MDDSGQKNKREEYQVAALIIAALAAAFLISAVVVKFDRIVGGSMKPALQENDWVLTSPLALHISPPVYGDIVVFQKKSVSDMPIVKRVIGTPGDTIAIKDGMLYINGRQVQDDVAPMASSETMEPVVVPKKCYFVMGDNREYSKDSRHWKDPFVKKEELKGKVVLTCFPKIQRIR